MYHSKLESAHPTQISLSTLLHKGPDHMHSEHDGESRSKAQEESPDISLAATPVQCGEAGAYHVVYSLALPMLP